MKPQTHKVTFMGIPITIGLLVSVAVLVLVSSGTLVNQTKTIVVTREEGDTMKGDISTLKNWNSKLEQKMESNQKETNEKMASMKSEIQDQMEKNKQDLKNDLERSQKTLKEELLSAIKDMKQDGIASQAFLIQRLTELRQSQIDTSRELRDKVDAVAFGLKRSK